MIWMVSDARGTTFLRYYELEGEGDALHGGFEGWVHLVDPTFFWKREPNFPFNFNFTFSFWFRLSGSWHVYLWLFS